MAGKNQALLILDWNFDMIGPLEVKKIILS
jgi:hypothetical protein